MSDEPTELGAKALDVLLALPAPAKTDGLYLDGWTEDGTYTYAHLVADKLGLSPQGAGRVLVGLKARGLAECGYGGVFIQHRWRATPKARKL